MNRIIVSVLCIFLLAISHVEIKAVHSASISFNVKNKDLSLSPYTGMTREHWKDAALYLLEGAFSYIHSLDDPFNFPKQEGKSYPRNQSMESTARLEALCRTMFLAGPLLKENPDLIINDIPVAKYYQRQITLLLEEGTPTYVPVNPPKQNGGQKLVELGGLAVSLMLAPEVFWEPLPQAVKDSLAVRMLSYGEGGTIEMNWRFFNINIMSFFKSRGYKTDDVYLETLIKKVLADYRGQGWYNDSPYYDYYSMWAFQMYGPLWAKYFGEKYYPEYAEQFMDNLSDIPDNYPNMFGRDGKMIMWGRSITYRMGASTPLALTGLLNDKNINYGWLRYISSSTILQFLQNKHFLKDRVPTLGFYGSFEPAVQRYSCRGSVFWMGKLFLALYMPENNPFWTMKENLGEWSTFETDKVYNKYAAESHILITNYPHVGASEIRSTASSEVIGVYQGTENYNRLSYNSEFPWQADGKHGEVAMNYVVKNDKEEWEAIRIFDFKKYDNGFYCREASLASNKQVRLYLAELPLPNGILRVDKITSPTPIEVRFGHYALTKKNSEMKKYQIRLGTHNTYVMDNGSFKLGMSSWKGWDKMEFIDTEGLHPESFESSLINACSRIEGERLFVTLLLFDKSRKKLKNYISYVDYSADNGVITVKLKDGKIYKLDI